MVYMKFRNKNPGIAWPKVLYAEEFPQGQTFASAEEVPDGVWFSHPRCAPEDAYGATKKSSKTTTAPTEKASPSVSGPPPVLTPDQVMATPEAKKLMTENKRTELVEKAMELNVTFAPDATKEDLVLAILKGSASDNSD